MLAHCLAGINRDDPEKDVIWMTAYVAPPSSLHSTDHSTIFCTALTLHQYISDELSPEKSAAFLNVMSLCFEFVDAVGSVSECYVFCFPCPNIFWNVLQE